MSKKLLLDDPLIRETISDIQHQIWSHWMAYLFDVSIPNQDGSYIIPVDKVLRWKKQLAIPYKHLTEKEKDSDREQAEKILDVLRYLASNKSRK